MFTGITRELGEVEAVEETEGGRRLRVRAPATAARARPGDSVAVSGVCLTATGVAGDVLAFDVVSETLRRSTLGRLRHRARVNLEPAVRVGEPLGGHLVQGHVDGTGHVRSLEPQGQGRRLELEVPEELRRYCVAKGSLAIDGVSVTIAELGTDTVAVALVPHTLAETTLGSVVAGAEVNLEVDVLAKYVERLLAARESEAGGVTIPRG
ncbi:MAG: riboflavin synthase [Actinomycetota bacterium]|nr:riboflavin synthase [Actinomycetota bacterium]